MRRALDAARSKLASLTSRDAIVDCYFEHAKTLFQTAVVLVVRGEVAQGRSAIGLEATDSLVSRLSIPLGEPGVLQRVREMRRPVVGIPNMTDADMRLFGTLGRTMPTALVSPLVVRDRVVAIFLGDAPAERLGNAARESGRTPMELAKEEMLVWSETVGEALEKLIVRTKAAGGSVPPPAFGSVPPPRIPSAPPPPRVPKIDAGAAPASTAPPPQPAYPSVDTSVSDVPPAPARSRSGRVVAALLATALLAGVGFFAWSRTRQPDPDRVLVPIGSIPGAPAAIDPIAAIDRARGVLTGKADLASIRAEVGAAGTVDLGKTPRAQDGVALAYWFAADDSDVEVRIEPAGIRAPRPSPRRMCGAGPCLAPVPPPKCTFAQVWTAAVGAGGGEERGVLTYAVDATGATGAAPIWTVEVPDRGRATVDASTCKLTPRSSLRPATLAVSAVPGAPHAVDPSAIVALARKQAGLDDDAVLLELDARGMGSKGTVDLAAGDASITMTFSDPANVASKTRRWRQVELRADGMKVTSDESSGAIPGRLDVAMPAPRCKSSHAVAYMTLGRPLEAAVARVTYGPDVGSHQGRWTMEVGTSEARRVITDVECEAWASVAH